jgi:uncharacterized membrane protein
MPGLILAIRSLHVLSAIALVGGIFARQIVRGAAAGSSDVRSFAALMDAARRIENALVIPGSVAAVLLGIVLGMITGAPILGFLQSGDRNWLLVANLIIVSLMAVPGLVFLPQRRRLVAALKLALEEGQITTGLKAVVGERSVRLWHVYEEIAVVAIVLLMALKPF